MLRARAPGARAREHLRLEVLRVEALEAQVAGAVEGRRLLPLMEPKI